VDEARLRDLLNRVVAGGTPVDEAVAELRHLPFADLGFAVVDHHRALRQGVPEVILGEGKTGEQIVGIARELSRNGGNVFVTRIDDEKAALCVREIPGMRHMPLARTCSLEQAAIPALSETKVALVSAGTSDMPVAEECAETMRMLGVSFERVFDVGVAGIHRLFHKRAMLEQAGVIIVIAGMEGALASVVGGLVEVPVIAVPTSVGYGASFQGLAALCGMLTSCASGITVVNIDNGFGAAFAAARILRGRHGGGASP
jgi:pyridinium-3,5-biscarboxylic acid mononucleotide synthase